jgi:uncharacterized protein
MLLEFRVQNFRALRDEQVLSLMASPSDKLLVDTHLHATGLASKGLAHAVRSAVIYGANASGKTTLLHALNFMRVVVGQSATLIQPGQTFNVQPFRLDAQREKEPTSFELTFMLRGVRHEYAFAMRPERILSESLRIYTTNKPTEIYRREFDPNSQTDRYEFSARLKGPKTLWQESTRPNALFLSTAAQLNSEILVPIFAWITQKIAMIPAGSFIDSQHTMNLMNTAIGKAQVQRFLSQADIAISEVKTVSRKGARQQVMLGSEGQIQTNRIEGDIVSPLFVHKTEAGSATFELHEESEGTQHLFGLIGPLVQVLQEGNILLVDELDGSLHALLVRQLVNLFHSAANSNGAQLIFTTHDTALLDKEVFRRDQIWFTEKDATQAARLYSLSEFSPRNNEAFEKNYLNGRYGGVPFLGQQLLESV